MIKGTRVNLRPITEPDLSLLRAWQSDPEVMAGWGIPNPLVASTNFAADLTGRFASFESSGYLIIESPDGPIGRIDYEHLDGRHGSCEIAMYIGDPGAQGRGFASDALRTLARHLFNQRGVHRIELTVIESNERARRLYERVGFVTEGLLRDYLWFNGEWHNELLMALFADCLLTESRTSAAS